MGGYILKGRKTSSMHVTLKERIFRVNMEGAVTKLVSVFFPHFSLCMSLAMYTDWQVNISNPDISSVFHICISTYLLTLPLRKSQNIPNLLLMNPFLKSDSLSEVFLCWWRHQHPFSCTEHKLGSFAASLSPSTSHIQFITSLLILVPRSTLSQFTSLTPASILVQTAIFSPQNTQVSQQVLLHASSSSEWVSGMFPSALLTPSSCHWPCLHMLSHSVLCNSATPWTVAC